MSIVRSESLWVFVILVWTAGCGPEITSVSPGQVRPDGVIVVEGKRMNKKISVLVSGGPVPTSDLEITQEKDKLGRFAFRMPSHDAEGKRLKPGLHEATLRVGGTTKQVEIELTGETGPPPPAASQFSAILTENGSGRLRLHGTQLRWPLKIRLAPIVPHGEDFGFTLDELRYDTSWMIDIPLPGEAIQLASYRVFLQNSIRYGSHWSKPAVAVFKP